ncbi:MAG: M48 family metallopeptidase [Myxococcota bacterium]|nr:M48 family metallopeptidase [Myxococcota bacterium]
MDNKWDAYRYGGDATDVNSLFELYRINDYLDAFDENRRRHDRGIREQLLQHGIRLNERLSPRIYNLFREVSENLEFQSEAEVFCMPDQNINAFAVLDLREEQTHSLIGVTAGALERLEDGELKSILGHELGHFLFGHNRLNALLSMDPSNRSMTVLPPFGESLFLRWRKKAEISCDRIGLVACRDFYASARSLLKATFGLSEKNLNLDIDALVSQIDEIKSSPELIESVFASHPILPIRLKALELFARSKLAKGCGCPIPGDPVDNTQIEKEVDELINLTQRHPVKPLSVAMMRAIALGGALVMGADMNISDDEVKLLVQILHGLFTDEPEKVIVTDRQKILDELPQVCEAIKKEGSDQDKMFVLSRLAEIAYADGALMDAEGKIILQVAEMLAFPSDRAYGIIVGAAQAGAFRTDVMLTRIATELRRSFAGGWTSTEAVPPGRNITK